MYDCRDRGASSHLTPLREKSFREYSVLFRWSKIFTNGYWRYLDLENDQWSVGDEPNAELYETLKVLHLNAGMFSCNN